MGLVRAPVVRWPRGDAVSTAARGRIARSAIDIAAHDAAARRSKLSLAELLGTSRADRIRLSWTVTGASPGDVEASLREAREAGFANCNIKLSRDAAANRQLVSIARRELADGFLWGDANGAPNQVAAERPPSTPSGGIRSAAARAYNW